MNLLTVAPCFPFKIALTLLTEAPIWLAIAFSAIPSARSFRTLIVDHSAARHV
jgi:hypothetical protein